MCSRCTRGGGMELLRCCGWDLKSTKLKRCQKYFFSSTVKLKCCEKNLKCDPIKYIFALESYQITNEWTVLFKGFQKFCYKKEVLVSRNSLSIQSVFHLILLQNHLRRCHIYLLVSTCGFHYIAYLVLFWKYLVWKLKCFYFD